MSIHLMAALFILMITNHFLGSFKGTCQEHFQTKRFMEGIRKITTIAIGYGIIAFIAYLAKDVIDEIEYISGLLLKPIAEYFLKLIDNVQGLIQEATFKREKSEEGTCKLAQAYRFTAIDYFCIIVLSGYSGVIAYDTFLTFVSKGGNVEGLIIYLLSSIVGVAIASVICFFVKKKIDKK